MDAAATFDLLIVGGGINGAGIARDAAGRGLAVALCDRGDFAGGTSSASTKLIHGGLRYLEHGDFRLVAESLAERETLSRIAAHLVRPLRFVMPHSPLLRPAWLIRAGLFLYDHLGGLYDRHGHLSLPASTRVELDTAAAYGAPLRGDLRTAFVYSDLAVDDARLVIANLRSAAASGATILPRSALVAAERGGRMWTATLVDRRSGERRQIRARALINAAGPWVMEVLGASAGIHAPGRIRLVKGSHLVLPRLYPGEHAYLLQNTDRRVVFLIPYAEQFTLLGTTELAVDSPPASVTAAEVDYLLAAANRYLKRHIRQDEIVWSYSGLRPLYDDGRSDPSAVSRDYTLFVDAAAQAPYVAIFGGKLTTYRHLAETVLARLAPTLKAPRGRWTGDAPLPGSAHFAGREQGREALCAGFPWLAPEAARALVQRHGSTAADVIGDATGAAELGRNFGGGLYEREVAYFVAHEWAREADDVLWRRSKAGLLMSAAERAEFTAWFGKAGR